MVTHGVTTSKLCSITHHVLSKKGSARHTVISVEPSTPPPDASIHWAEQVRDNDHQGGRVSKLPPYKLI